MKIDLEIRKLRHDRDRELLNLKQHSHRAAHRFSPTRNARNHPYLFAGGAFLVGMWLAPRPKTTTTPERGPAPKPPAFDMKEILLQLLQFAVPSAPPIPQTEKVSSDVQSPAQPTPFAGVSENIMLLIENASNTLQIVNALGGLLIDKWQSSREQHAPHMAPASIGALSALDGNAETRFRFIDSEI